MAPSPEFMQDLWVRKIFSTIGHTLLVYDYCLTLEDEVYYIWNSPWTVVKVMFLINRYGNLIGQTFIQLEETGLISHGSQFCQRFAFATACFMALSAESIHIIVLMRTWAIWGTQKRVANILIWSYVSYILVMTGTATHGAITSHLQFAQLDVTHICVTDAPIHYFKDYIWLICCGKEFRSLYPSDLLHILVRDAIIFFILITLLKKKKRTVYADDPKCFIAKGFATPLISVAGQRLVLNLRGSEGRTYTTRDLSREVDRQLEAFVATDSPCRDDMGHPESGQK
ncbi:hypothetical protein DFJ58DRAFT_855428 [Suillus subalutaceus]|uniref:uncharacterized protein n=1 Tax=Suillus subalutaceus TaxID=48586 RepID=UPI001B865BC9|nr:uncharacterized protein DFJ58DRAFT_855428 [Suillus subalutaceus]KAG1842274.1 hypothetical protein DFJ58DRAFT_855428 [Suillus subalutaceus]